MAKHTLHRNIFKVCLAIFQHYHEKVKFCFLNIIIWNWSHLSSQLLYSWKSQNLEQNIQYAAICGVFKNRLIGLSSFLRSQSSYYITHLFHILRNFFCRFSYVVRVNCLLRTSLYCWVSKCLYDTRERTSKPFTKCLRKGIYTSRHEYQVRHFARQFDRNIQKFPKYITAVWRRYSILKKFFVVDLFFFKTG